METEQIQVEDGISDASFSDQAQIVDVSQVEDVGNLVCVNQAITMTPTIQEDCPSHYGNNLAELRDENSILFTFLNVNGLPQQATKHKNRTIRNFINYNNIDVFGLQKLILTGRSYQPRTNGRKGR